MTTKILFSSTQCRAIERLRRDLSTRVRRKVSAEFGQTEDGQQWAALSVQDLPPGSFGAPGPLVSILTGTGIPGPAAVMGADGVPLADGIKFSDALKAARSAGVRQYRVMSRGAFARASIAV